MIALTHNNLVDQLESIFYLSICNKRETQLLKIASAMARFSVLQSIVLHLEVPLIETSGWDHATASIEDVFL